MLPLETKAGLTALAGLKAVALVATGTLAMREAEMVQAIAIDVKVWRIEIKLNMSAKDIGVRGFIPIPNTTTMLLCMNCTFFYLNSTPVSGFVAWPAPSSLTSLGTIGFKQVTLILFFTMI